MAKHTAAGATKLVSKGVASLAPALDSMAVITACLEYLRVREEEASKRAYITARRDIIVAAITAERDLIKEYFERRSISSLRSLKERWRRRITPWSTARWPAFSASSRITP